jgi:hypothetical protein
MSVNIPIGLPCKVEFEELVNCFEANNFSDEDKCAALKYGILFVLELKKKSNVVVEEITRKRVYGEMNEKLMSLENELKEKEMYILMQKKFFDDFKVEQMNETKEYFKSLRENQQIFLGVNNNFQSTVLNLTQVANDLAKQKARHDLPIARKGRTGENILADLVTNSLGSKEFFRVENVSKTKEQTDFHVYFKNFKVQGSC